MRSQRIGNCRLPSPLRNSINSSGGNFNRALKFVMRLLDVHNPHEIVRKLRIPNTAANGLVRSFVDWPSQ